MNNSIANYSLKQRQKIANARTPFTYVCSKQTSLDFFYHFLRFELIKLAYFHTCAWNTCSNFTWMGMYSQTRYDCWIKYFVIFIFVEYEFIYVLFITRLNVYLPLTIHPNFAYCNESSYAFTDKNFWKTSTWMLHDIF